MEPTMLPAYDTTQFLMSCGAAVSALVLAAAAVILGDGADDVAGV